MMKKRDAVPYMVLAGVFALLVLLNIFFLDHWLDSDMAAEMMFSKLLSEEGHLFATRNWFYSSEFRVLYTQLVMTPLFWVFDSWHVVRALTNIVFYVLLTGSYWYMMKPLGLKRKWVVWTSVILLLPFSETLMTHMQMGNTYMSHVILIFFVFGMFLRLGGRKKAAAGWKKAALALVYCALCMILGLSGIRYMLALLCPLVLAAFWEMLASREFQSLRREVSGKHIRAFCTQKKAAYMGYALLGAFMALAGYAANIFVAAARYSFQTYETVNFIAVYKGIFWERLQNTLGSLLMLFGYIADKAFLSLRGLVTLAAFILLGLCIYFAVKSRKLAALAAEEKQEDTAVARHFLYVFFLIAFVLNTFVFLFTNSTVVDRYYITVLIFILPLIAVFFEKETMALDRLVAGVLLAGCLFLGTAKVVYSFVATDKNEDTRAVAGFLEENGYEFGYATYWNANIITELTDGKVEVANITAPESMEFFKWSSPAKYYTAEYADRASFLLLTAEEAEEYSGSQAADKMVKVYEEKNYVVFGLE